MVGIENIIGIRRKLFSSFIYRILSVFLAFSLLFFGIFIIIWGKRTTACAVDIMKGGRSQPIDEKNGKISFCFVLFAV